MNIFTDLGYKIAWVLRFNRGATRDCPCSTITFSKGDIPVTHRKIAPYTNKDSEYKTAARLPSELSCYNLRSSRRFSHPHMTNDDQREKSGLTLGEKATYWSFAGTVGFLAVTIALVAAKLERMQPGLDGTGSHGAAATASQKETVVFDYMKDQPPSKGVTVATSLPPIVGTAQTPFDGEVINSEALKAQKIVVLEGIHFKSGSAQITSGNESVGAIANVMREGQCSRLEIAGHTDLTGSDKINLPLSLDRAEAVKQALVQLGIAADRLLTVGKGSSEPLTPRTDQAGNAYNRRVEVRCVS